MLTEKEIEIIEDFFYDSLVEWTYHSVDKGPDEYHCPDGCVVRLVNNEWPGGWTNRKSSHKKDCRFEKIKNIFKEKK